MQVDFANLAEQLNATSGSLPILNQWVLSSSMLDIFLTNAEMGVPGFDLGNQIDGGATSTLMIAAQPVLQHEPQFVSDSRSFNFRQAIQDGAAQ